MKKQLVVYFSMISLLVLAIMIPVAGAYETYSAGCEGCHGNFRASTYSSQAVAKAANPAWPGTSLALHNGHANASTANPPGMLNGNCNACHFGSSKTPVYTYQSSGAAPFNQSCLGCHDGPGLRAHHVNRGADTCYDCHNDPAPDAENVLRPVYAAAFGTASGTTGVNDACNPTAAGFEGRLKDVTTLGLDNDGNLLYDQADPACAPASAPKISVSPTPLTFGNQATGSTSAAKTVTISNTGSASLNVTAISNSNATDFNVTASSTPFSIAAGGSQTFSVVFAPVSTGAKSATITVASNAGNPTVSAAGTGTVPPLPILGVSPTTTLAFGNQTVGTTSITKTVTLSNTGNASLTVNGLTNSNATDFVVAGVTVPITIAAGGNQTFTVAFKPGSTGAKSASISIASNGGNGSVSASGTGVAVAAPVLGVSPTTTLAFGNQTVGTTSTTQTVTLSNTGNASLTVSSITNNNTTDFVMAGVTVPITIAAGGNQTFTVAFKPGSTGAKSASISIASNGGNGSVSASGTGVAIVTQPVLSVLPASLTFTNVTVSSNASKTVTISNTGNTPLNIGSITQAGSSAFSFSPASLPAIAAGGSATLTVTYAPTVEGVDPGSSINITSNGGNATVSLTGTALQQPTGGTGDVALVKLSVPSQKTEKVGERADIHVRAEATSTVKDANATVALTAAAADGVKVSIARSKRTGLIKAGGTDPKKFEFEAKISCMKSGTWPITWTVKISAAGNSNPANDTLTATTQVTCSGNKRERTEDSGDRRLISQYRWDQATE